MSITADHKPPVLSPVGNDERMVLEFLERLEKTGSSWLRNLGLQAIVSFGLAPPQREGTGAGAFEELRSRLEDAMGEDMIGWLQARPLTWNSGNVWAVHAAADPGIPMTAQTECTLLWGHPEFNERPRTDGQWVVHGRTIFETPQVQGGRIAVDTGAYATGCLSAALITPDRVTFRQTGRD